MPDRRHTLSVLFREDSTLTPFGLTSRKTGRRRGAAGNGARVAVDFATAGAAPRAGMDAVD